MRDSRRRLIVDTALEAHLRGRLDQVQDSPRPHRLQILWAKVKGLKGLILLDIWPQVSGGYRVCLQVPRGYSVRAEDVTEH